VTETQKPENEKAWMEFFMDLRILFQ